MRHIVSLTCSGLLFALPALAETPLAESHIHMSPPAASAEIETPQASEPPAPSQSRRSLMGHRSESQMSMMGGRSHLLSLMEKYPEGQLAFLKTELKITPEQEALWITFANTLKAYAVQMNGMRDMMRQQRRDRSESVEKALPEEMGMKIQMMEAHLASMKSYQTSLTQFYLGLTDAQKKVADELLKM